MISRISYFVIYSPKYIETARQDNFYLGNMSALLQQLRHYYTCYFTTGDTKNIFGAVTLWPHVHKCWCRTKVCLTGAHTFCSTLTYQGPQRTFIMLVQVALSLSVLLWWVYDQLKRWKEWKISYLQHTQFHFFIKSFSPMQQIIFYIDEKRNECNNQWTLSIRNAFQCAIQAVLLQVQAFLLLQGCWGS